ncbi:type II secretion system protein [Caulobacter sp. UNC279MFTsu5.1]|uniref:type II secretion system protein n=1 Tax=Caulobacter sp. UNC279MFTsu5.1 TaxID=1502775 RepID=UPI0008DFFE27|nr:type II secretion system protein [Caulobacter sp. UNC279MFTsu5.1]SFJ79939.1 prepilin-type N-terminal cleavage/methylation domain-containing protein [Caulobacter sp. UNC279MFTsu5.1]
MNDDGYTLAEMLAALAILGMAIGGLGLVVSLIARQQLTANRTHMQLLNGRAADRALTLWLADVDAETLTGDSRSLSAACGLASCSALLEADKARTALILKGRLGPARRFRLRQRDVRFGYVADQGVVAGWPQPAVSGEEGLKETLHAVRLAAPGAAVPLAVARAWTREPRDCQFDAIIGACRVAAP